MKVQTRSDVIVAALDSYCEREQLETVLHTVLVVFVQAADCHCDPESQTVHGEQIRSDVVVGAVV